MSQLDRSCVALDPFPVGDFGKPVNVIELWTSEKENPSRIRSQPNSTA